MLFRTILFNFILFIDGGLQIPGNVSKRLFSAYQTHQYDCKNKQKSVVGAKKSYFFLITQFDAQNAGNSVSELPDFKFFFFWGGGGMPPDPPRKRGLAAPCQYRRLLFSNWLPTSNFIETPASMFSLNIFSNQDTSFIHLILIKVFSSTT